MHFDCQNSVSSELVYVLSWNYQRILKGDDQLTNRQYVHTTTNTTATATFTSSTITITIASITTSITTICMIKGTKMKISKKVYDYIG